MSTVIKSGAAAGDMSVRGLAVVPALTVLSAEARLIAELERQLEAAQTELVARDQEIQRLSSIAADAFSDGRAQGLIEGRKAAEDYSAALVRAVSDAAGKSAALFQERLGGLEEAVGGLAALALERIVGPGPDRQAMVADTVRRAIRDLFTGAVVAVEVSREDFANADLLRAALPPECDVRLLEGIPSGGCLLRLRMGEVDLDLQGQAARLRAVLDPAGSAVA
jgi:flagellar biosynthesis/type III secretory pathway protein FliH